MKLQLGGLEKNPDIWELYRKKDLSGLTRALHHPDLKVQGDAAFALSRVGTEGVDYLIRALRTRNRGKRIGIIEALGMTGDARAIAPLGTQLKDRSNEVRWAAALALGEIRDAAVIQPLKEALRDADKYVRYGAALSLRKNSWEPENLKEKAFLLAALQEWEEIEQMGACALSAVENTLRDTDRNIRLRAVMALRALAVPGAIFPCYEAIRDPDEEVRWEAVRAASACGLPARFLPRALLGRPKTQKNPYIAGFLNFMLPGMGYSYLGLWWGLLIFQIDVYATVLIFTTTGEFLSLSILFPIYFVIAIHAWYIAKKRPDL
ncbi:MAG: HEAT repeat domain-containing protein [Methanolinea sp.]|nr:HEAT repeat domain-containing protein [Methanolinea sp.]